MDAGNTSKIVTSQKPYVHVQEFIRKSTQLLCIGGILPYVRHKYSLL